MYSEGPIPSLKMGAEDIVQYFLDLYNDWAGVKQLEGTAERVTRAFEEFCWPPETIRVELEKQFKTFEEAYNQMLVTGPIEIYTLCPHHLLPCKFLIHIGMVPDGRVLGLSKFSRISEIMAKRPIMQEQYSRELADKLFEKLKPKGIAVNVRGSHGCMTARGVRQHNEFVTSTLLGCFYSEAITRAEFFAICNRG